MEGVPENGILGKRETAVATLKECMNVINISLVYT